MPERNRLVEIAGEEFAPAEPRIRRGRVAIERNRRLVFRDGVAAIALRAQQLPLDIMRPGTGRRCLERPIQQPFGALQIGRRRGAEFVENAADKRAGQADLRAERVGVEHQGTLEEADCLVGGGGRHRFGQRRPPAQDVVLGIRVVGQPAGLGGDHPRSDRTCDPSGNLGLQAEQLLRVAIEPLGP